MSINLVVEIGNLTKDAELKYTNRGYSVLNFTIAVNEKEKKGEVWVDTPSFFDVKLLGKRAESLSSYLNKGVKVGVSGKLKQDRWEQNGQTRSKVYILANDVQLLSPKKQTAQQDYKEPFQDDIQF